MRGQTDGQTEHGDLISLTLIFKENRLKFMCFHYINISLMSYMVLAK